MNPAKLTLEQIRVSALWMVKYKSGYDKTCVYSQIDHDNMEVCAQQPESLRPLFDTIYATLEKPEEFIKEKIF